jgi:hypothetical protein
MQLRQMVMEWIFGLFQIILLFMKLIFLLMDFGRTIRTASVVFIVMPYFLFMLSIGLSVVPWYWSMMDLSES